MKKWLFVFFTAIFIIPNDVNAQNCEIMSVQREDGQIYNITMCVGPDGIWRPIDEIKNSSMPNSVISAEDSNDQQFENTINPSVHTLGISDIEPSEAQMLASLRGHPLGSEFATFNMSIKSISKRSCMNMDHYFYHCDFNMQLGGSCGQNNVLCEAQKRITGLKVIRGKFLRSNNIWQYHGPVNNSYNSTPTARVNSVNSEIRNDPYGNCMEDHDDDTFCSCTNGAIKRAGVSQSDRLTLSSGTFATQLRKIAGSYPSLARTAGQCFR